MMHRRDRPAVTGSGSGWNWVLGLAARATGWLVTGGRRLAGWRPAGPSPPHAERPVERRSASERRRRAGWRMQWRGGAMRRVWFGSLTDPLTGLANRAGFQRALEAASARLGAGASLSVLVVDLDQFAPLNDAVGPASGDRLLRCVARRLRAHVARSQQLGRLGGHAFAVYLDTAHESAALAGFGRQLIEAVSAPIYTGGRSVRLSCSIGAAVAPLHGDCTRLVGHAEAAVAAAKRAGGATFLVYSPRMKANPAEQLSLQHDLRRALDRGELRLYYQPKVQATTGRISGVEALVRWQHPTRGLLGPDVFIPVAEQFGLIGVLGAWVVEAICVQLQAWESAGLRMRASINVSVYQLRQDDLVQRLRKALIAHRVDPTLLTLEITESVAMDDAEATRAAFCDLAEVGVTLSIDDFGTGYSSLSHLRKLPATQLKIDQSFVHDLAHSDDARAVVKAVVGLAQALDLKVVAEGVETDVQRRILTELGCDELQGFLFARPLTAEAFAAWALTGKGPAPIAFEPALYAEAAALGG